MKSRYVVWAYMAKDENYRLHRRLSFFHAGSEEYTGWWMGPTDSVWFVPSINPWIET